MLGQVLITFTARSRSGIAEIRQEVRKDGDKVSEFDFVTEDAHLVSLSFDLGVPEDVAHRDGLFSVFLKMDSCDKSEDHPGAREDTSANISAVFSLGDAKHLYAMLGEFIKQNNE